MPKKSKQTIVQLCSDNFNTAIHAAKTDRIALLECVERKSGKRRAVIVAVNLSNEGGYEFVPLAVMLEGDPYKQLCPPKPEGGFAKG